MFASSFQLIVLIWETFFYDLATKCEISRSQSVNPQPFRSLWQSNCSHVSPVGLGFLFKDVERFAFAEVSFTVRLSEMAAADFEIEDLITCSVCFLQYDETLRIPKDLQCFHTVCLQCLKVKLRLTRNSFSGVSL